MTLGCDFLSMRHPLFYYPPRSQEAAGSRSKGKPHGRAAQCPLLGAGRCSAMCGRAKLLPGDALVVEVGKYAARVIFRFQSVQAPAAREGQGLGHEVDMKRAAIIYFA